MTDQPDTLPPSEQLREAVLAGMAEVCAEHGGAPGLLLGYYVVAAAATVGEDGNEATRYYRMHSQPLAPLHVNLGLLEYARRRELEIYFPGDDE